MAKFNPEEWEARIKREIEEEEIRAQAGRDFKMDQEFLGDAYYLLGLNPSEIAELGKDIPELVSTDEALRAIKKGKKELKKGNARKAKKILDSNKDVKKLAKQAKKGKGCAVTLLALASGGLIAFATLIYGAVEAVASVLR